MCGDIGRGVWLHAGEIAKANIIPVIGQESSAVRAISAGMFLGSGRDTLPNTPIATFTPPPY